jgi:hypothetical protein
MAVAAITHRRQRRRFESIIPLTPRTKLAATSALSG